jgi:hypothetical protein
MRYWLLLALLGFIRASLACDSLAELRQVGSADLTVWGFKVYTAQTLSCSGTALAAFPQLPSPFALEIHYARDIDRDDLLNRTAQAWQRQGRLSAQDRQWLNQLAVIWPHVTAGDRLLMWVKPSAEAEFLHNGQVVGVIQDPAFASRFAAIWLAPNASHPKLREKLLGEQR